MTTSYKQPGSGLENSHSERMEDSLLKQKRQKFYAELREQFGDGLIDARSHKFTDILLKHVLTREEVKELDHETKQEWYKRVRRIIIDKLGGYAEAGQNRKVFEEKKREEEEENKTEASQETVTDEESETVESFIARIERGIFYSD